ncbi:hypothetical protein DPSP01_006817 [Paraphaeosphaeria sporulosa]|uniref:Rhodopsin domain-containing protein n=1 Tax=Paraphaeosphaeria sporulosa TaxID=1460663 RepID=A0A177CM90_9PLEO|nr:uncharacterized protein CC84DRAFT_1086136 [Paraphaeosphaeria sporulosa]OAG08416.1 hypothetical protein CC84DRAFT_1086136 [Paraphaeosphaeria sporulosa]
MAAYGTLAIVVAFTLSSLSTVVVALRFYARYYLVGKLGPADWVMLAALIATWGTPVLNYYQVQYTDYSTTIDSKGNLIVDEFKRIASGGLLTMWIFRLNYIINHLLIKTSILLFYSYVVSASRAYYWTVRIMLGFNIMSCLAMALVSVFICNPPQLSWDGDVFYKEFFGIFPTQCINPSPLWLTQASYNLATDAILWLLPVPFFLNLRAMPVRKRVELVAIFSIGIVAISASAVRLSVTIRWLSGFDELGLLFTSILVWSQVEQHSGIIAASLPFLRPIFRKLVKKMIPRSPSPEFKLVPNISPQGPPMPPRPPIIPSPVATFGSDESFRPPPTPLSPIKPEMEMFHTV